MYPGWNAHLRIYSPLHPQHYVRTTGLIPTYPAEQTFRSREPAWWNLIWLTSPEVDDALGIWNEETHAAYLSRARRRRMAGHYRDLRRLIRAPEMHRGISMARALTTLSATDFVEHFSSLPYRKFAPFIDDDRQLLELMRARAQFACAPKLRWRTGPCWRHVKRIGLADLDEYIAHSERDRTEWLDRAYEQFAHHVCACGFEPPRLRFEIDRFLLRRHGCCWRSQDGINRICISPQFVDCDCLMHTLAHEVVHAIDDCQHGHYPQFFAIAHKLGFTGQRLCQLRPGEKLKGVLGEIRRSLEAYPHFRVRL